MNLRMGCALCAQKYLLPKHSMPTPLCGQHFLQVKEGQWEFCVLRAALFQREELALAESVRE